MATATKEAAIASVATTLENKDAVQYTAQHCLYATQY